MVETSFFVIQEIPLSPSDKEWMLYFHKCGFSKNGMASFKDSYREARRHIRMLHKSDKVPPVWLDTRLGAVAISRHGLLDAPA